MYDFDTRYIINITCVLYSYMSNKLIRKQTYNADI